MDLFCDGEEYQLKTVTAAVPHRSKDAVKRHLNLYKLAALGEGTFKRTPLADLTSVHWRAVRESMVEKSLELAANEEAEAIAKAHNLGPVPSLGAFTVEPRHKKRSRKNHPSRFNEEDYMLCLDEEEDDDDSMSLLGVPSPSPGYTWYSEEMFDTMDSHSATSAIDLIQAESEFVLDMDKYRSVLDEHHELRNKRLEAF